MSTHSAHGHGPIDHQPSAQLQPPVKGVSVPVQLPSSDPNPLNPVQGVGVVSVNIPPDARKIHGLSTSAFIPPGHQDDLSIEFAPVDPDGLHVELEPDNELDVELEPVNPRGNSAPSQKVVFYNKAPSGSVYHPRMHHQHKKKLERLFAQVEQDINTQYNRNGGVTLELSKGHASFKYTDHSGEELVEHIDLVEWAERDPVFQQHLEDLQECVDEIYPYKAKHRPQLTAGYKGIHNGSTPIERESAALKALPHSADAFAKAHLPDVLCNHTDPKHRSVLMQRLAVAELTINRKRAKMEELLARTQTEYDALLAQNPRDPAAIRNKRRDLDHLKQAQETYQLDQLALQMALIFHPIDPKAKDQEYVKQAEALRMALAILLKAQPGSAEEVYAADVGGLLIRNRWDYFDYCRKHGVSMKKVSPVEKGVKEAIALVHGKVDFQEAQQEFDRDFAPCSPTLKTDIQKAFRKIRKECLKLKKQTKFFMKQNPPAPQQDAAHLQNFRTAVIGPLQIPQPPAPPVPAPAPKPGFFKKLFG